MNELSIKHLEEICDKLRKELNNAIRLRTEDNRFNMIALNLSGEREDLEKQAYELIDKHGTLKALKMSRNNNG